MPENVTIPADGLTSVEPQLRRVFSADKYQPESMINSSSDTINSCPEFSRLIPQLPTEMVPTLDPSQANSDSHHLENAPIIEILSQQKQFLCLRHSLGVFLALGSGFCNSIVALLVKLIDSVGTFEIAVFRYVIMLVPLIITLACKRMNPFNRQILRKSGWVLVLRAAVGSASTYSKYFALHKLPLADASVILFSSPVFVSLLARIFLKERFRWIHGAAIFVTLGGCILVSRPTFIFGSAGFNPNVEWDDHMWGCLSALASALFTASVYVTVRHMKDVESSVVLFWTAFVGLIISAIATEALDYFTFPTDPWEIGYILGVGIITLISQESLNRALKLESAGLISLLRTGDIVWSFFWQVIIFKTVPHYFSIIGALMVVFCVAFISLREAAEKMPPDSRIGKVIRQLNGSLDHVSFNCCCEKSVANNETTREHTRP